MLIVIMLSAVMLIVIAPQYTVQFLIDSKNFNGLTNDWNLSILMVFWCYCGMCGDLTTRQLDFRKKSETGKF